MTTTTTPAPTDEQVTAAIRRLAAAGGDPHAERAAMRAALAEAAAPAPTDRPCGALPTADEVARQVADLLAAATVLQRIGTLARCYIRQLGPGAGVEIMAEVSWSDYGAEQDRAALAAIVRIASELAAPLTIGGLDDMHGRTIVHVVTEVGGVPVRVASPILTDPDIRAEARRVAAASAAPDPR
jgi:hypothetical protein